MGIFIALGRKPQRERNGSRENSRKSIVVGGPPLRQRVSYPGTLAD